jgi:hypothetical protein
MSRQSTHKGGKVVSLTHRPPLPPPPPPKEIFLVLISVRRWVDPRVILRPEGLSTKNSNDIIGNRTRDLPACSVTQPTAPPRAPTLNLASHKFDVFSYKTSNITTRTERRGSKHNWVAPGSNLLAETADRRSKIIRNVGTYIPVCKTSYPRGQESYNLAFLSIKANLAMP